MTEHLLTREEAAHILRTSSAGLAGMAYTSTGPPFYKVGKRCLYAESELLAWLETRRVGGKGVRR